MNVDEDVITNSRLVDYVYLTIRWIDIILDSRLKSCCGLSSICSFQLKILLNALKIVIEVP
jgi:hypothetical protein